MKIKNWKIFAGLVLLAVMAGLFSYRVKIKWWFDGFLKNRLPEETSFDQSKATATPENADSSPGNQEKTTTSTPPAPKETGLKANINLKVPYTMQAPFSNWAEPWQNACEEASILMAYYYFANKTFTKEIARDEILKLVSWQNENFSSYLDTTAEETGLMAQKNWGYNYEVLDNPTVEQIKSYLNKGLPVLVPLAGRLLGNPYFKQPGPIYHMVVIKGYTTDGKFITNDPGNGHGYGYLYSYNTIMSAMHDWNKTGDITEGAKKILILYPKD